MSTAKEKGEKKKECGGGRRERSLGGGKGVL
jgi:hypothetical protein